MSLHVLPQRGWWHFAEWHTLVISWRTVTTSSLDSWPRSGISPANGSRRPSPCCRSASGQCPTLWWFSFWTPFSHATVPMRGWLSTRVHKRAESSLDGRSSSGHTEPACLHHGFSLVVDPSEHLFIGSIEHVPHVVHAFLDKHPPLASEEPPTLSYPFLQKSGPGKSFTSAPQWAPNVPTWPELRSFAVVLSAIKLKTFNWMRVHLQKTLRYSSQ